MLKNFALLFLASHAAEIAFGEKNPLIVGGRDAAVGQFPYMVSIRFTDELYHGAGGGILNKRWVLTVSIRGKQFECKLF